MNHEYSCGAVVFTREGGAVRYLLIETPSGAYGFPKGHMEAGETERQTALREINEEAGVRVTLIEGFRHETSYLLHEKAGTVKHVTYFLGSYEGQTPTPQPGEVTRSVLLPYDAAIRRVTHEGNRLILEHAARFLRGKGIV